jgi:hypothetical protein
LSDTPVQDKKRNRTDLVDSEERYGRCVIVGARLGSAADDSKDAVAPGREGKRLVPDEQLFSAEEGDAGPIDEFGQIFLGVDQRVVVLTEFKKQVDGAYAGAKTEKFQLAARFLRAASNCSLSWRRPVLSRYTSIAQRTAPTTLPNSMRLPSPARLKTRR